jgi:P-type Ca2+ transporter type 2C
LQTTWLLVIFSQTNELGVIFLFDQFNITNLYGLSSAEARRLLNVEGPNELPSAKNIQFFHIFLKIIREPMFLLLLFSVGLYFILGSTEEAAMLLGFVLIIIFITFYQEQKSEKALLALRKLSCPRVLVIRDGKAKRISGSAVVCGDIIGVAEGDKIAADALLLSSVNLLVDEAMLTGESFPIQKNSESNVAKHIYSGTNVVQGYGMAKVIATGLNTAIGKIGKSLRDIVTERTGLQRETDKLVLSFAVGGLIICAVIVLIYGITRHNFVDGFLVGITLAMAILPEEFPVILAVFLAIGAWRISLKRVLTRRLAAIEVLGSATVLCVDKTGTLTENTMAVSQIYAGGQLLTTSLDKSYKLPETFHQVIEYGVLSSQHDPFDPMEVAIKKFGQHHLNNTEHIHKNWKFLQQYPLSKELLAISLVWQSPHDHNYIIAAKGAPESIFDLCHLTVDKIDEYSLIIQQMAAAGLRILGIAKANFQQNDMPLPEGQHEFNFEFIGLIGLADPIRSNVPMAVAKCFNAGIRVIMLTGDYQGTAKNIAQQIGLKNPMNIIIGSELDKFSDAELKEKIRSVNIFARILPEQKLRLVNALKANGEIVAMTGDGINDTPALKAAHIGIAMGKRGTDVARETADLVLINDDFTAIVSAVCLGRKIYNNIRKAFIYTCAAHIPIIGMSFIPVLFKWPLVLMPIHIVFLELIIDPACSIVFEAEPEEPNIMNKPPRLSTERLFNRNTIIASLWRGLGALGITLIIFSYARWQAFSEGQVRELTFISLVVTNLLLILLNRYLSFSFRGILKVPNRALWLVLVGAFVLLTVVLFVPYLRHVFYFN